MMKSASNSSHLLAWIAVGASLLAAGDLRGQGTCAVNPLGPILDGSFEGGSPNGDWAETSVNFGSVICDVASCGSGAARTGSWWVWLGGTDMPETGSAEQTIQIPVGTDTLTFYLQIAAASGNGQDFMAVLVDGVTQVLIPEFAPGFSTYAPVDLAVGTFADGGFHTIRFYGQITGSPSGSSFFIDDVALCSCGLPSNPVADPGFEAGTPNPSWTEQSLVFGTPLCDANCGTGGGTGPHSGAWWAWFGGTDMPENGSVEQSVTIPSGANTLSFYLEIPVRSGNGTDFVRALVDGNQVFEALESTAGYGVYAPVRADISAWADDQPHLVRFESTISGSPAGTNFFVDDVAVEKTCPYTFPTLYQSVSPAGVVDPANALFALSVSGLGFTPPSTRLLFYKLDDGAGNPARFYLVWQPPVMRVLFP